MIHKNNKCQRTLYCDHSSLDTKHSKNYAKIFQHANIFIIIHWYVIRMAANQKWRKVLLCTHCNHSWFVFLIIYEYSFLIYQGVYGYILILFHHFIHGNNFCVFQFSSLDKTAFHKCCLFLKGQELPLWEQEFAPGNKFFPLTFFALKKATTANDFGLSECNRVKS